MEVTMDMNTSTMNYTKEELTHAYEALKTKMVHMQQDIESKSQQIYDLQREVARVSALEADYIQELEAVQSRDNTKTRECEEKLAELVEEKSKITACYKEQIEFLEVQLNAKEDVIKHLEEKEKLSVALAESVVITQAEHDKLINENSKLHELVETLTDNCKDFECQLDELKGLNGKINVALESSKTMSDRLHEDYTIKTQELREAKELNETLQEEMALLRNEMETVKNKPLDDELRGNSLFAEVDDRRVQLQKNVSSMKRQYIEMRREHVTLLNQIANLKAENLVISKRWEEDMALREREDLKPVNVYTNRIATLEELVKEQEALLASRRKPDENDSEFDEVKFLENMLSNKDKELKALMEKVNKESLTRMLTSRELIEKSVELSELKSKSSRLECEVSQLKTQLELLKLHGSNENVPDIKSEGKIERKSRFAIIDIAKKINAANALKSDLLPTKTLSLLTPTETERDCKQPDETQKKLSPLSLVKIEKNSSDNEKQEKENKPEKKSVKFSEDTVDVNVTNRKKLRKPGMIITCPKVYISSAVKKEC